MQAKAATVVRYMRETPVAANLVGMPRVDRRQRTKRWGKITSVFPYARLPLNT